MGGGGRSKPNVSTGVPPRSVARGPLCPHRRTPHLLAKGPPNFFQGVLPPVLGRLRAVQEEVPGGGFGLLILPGGPCEKERASGVNTVRGTIK